MADSTVTPPSYKHIVFSDVDGTLVHYPRPREGSVAKDGDDDSELIHLPPSKTGTRGVISVRTLQLCHKLRHGTEEGTASDVTSERQRMKNGGVPLVLVSGMRTTTLFQRLPYLPRADAYVSESGGRIFYPVPASNEAADGSVEGLTAQPISYSGMTPSEEAPFSLVEDMHWRERLSDPNAAGLDGYDDKVPIEERSTKLWEFARSLREDGYVLDVSGYATAFRINRKHQNPQLASTFDAFLALCATGDGTPRGLGCSTNLGCVDVYPKMSGKRNCAEYLLQRFLKGDDKRETMVSLRMHAYCMCDDDNDAEMALACKAAYLPSVTSESMRELARLKDTLVVMEDEAGGNVESRATEAALEAIMKELE